MLVRLHWFILTGLFMVALEVFLASNGILFPAGLFMAFYIGLAFGLRRGMVCGLIVSILVEILALRSTTLMPVFLPALGFLILYQRLGDRSSAINHAVSGFALAGVHAGWLILFENLHLRHGWSLLSGVIAIRLFITALLGSAIGFPVLIRIFDTLAKRLAIERFTVQTSRVR